MSVIVKGIKMPDCCAGCRLSDSDDDGIYCTALEVFMRFNELPKGRRDDCPLVELKQCRDCKHWKSGFADVGGCDMFKSAGIRCSTMAEFFCAMATPKETEE